MNILYVNYIGLLPVFPKHGVQQAFLLLLMEGIATFVGHLVRTDFVRTVVSGPSSGDPCGASALDA